MTKEEGGEEEEKEEGGGEGEVEEGGGEGEGAPIVFEMPIEMQGYRVIDQSGPGGINNAVRQHLILHYIIITSSHIAFKKLFYVFLHLTNIMRKKFWPFIIALYFICASFKSPPPPPPPPPPPRTHTRRSVMAGSRWTLCVPDSSQKLSSRAKM